MILNLGKEIKIIQELDFMLETTLWLTCDHD